MDRGREIIEMLSEFTPAQVQEILETFERLKQLGVAYGSKKIEPIPGASSSNAAPGAA